VVFLGSKTTELHVIALGGRQRRAAPSETGKFEQAQENTEKIFDPLKTTEKIAKTFKNPSRFRIEITYIFVLLEESLTGEIIAAAIEVHKAFGPACWSRFTKNAC